MAIQMGKVPRNDQVLRDMGIKPLHKVRIRFRWLRDKEWSTPAIWLLVELNPANGWEKESAFALQQEFRKRNMWSKWAVDDKGSFWLMLKPKW